MNMRNMIKITLVLIAAVAALVAGLFVGSADGQSLEVDCRSVSDNWSASTSVIITDDFIEFEWEKRPTQRVAADASDCNSEGLDAFLKQTRAQSSAIASEDCRELRLTYERALASQRVDLRELPNDALDEPRQDREAPGRSNSAQALGNVVAIPNPRSIHIESDITAEGAPGQFPPILFDLDWAKEILQTECR